MQHQPLTQDYETHIKNPDVQAEMRNPSAQTIGNRCQKHRCQVNSKEDASGLPIAFPPFVVARFSQFHGIFQPFKGKLKALSAHRLSQGA